MNITEARTYDSNSMICNDDIANELMYRAGVKDDEISIDLVEVLYQIEAIAQNEYNHGYWRTLYNILATFAENSDRNRHFEKYVIIRQYDDNGYAGERVFRKVSTEKIESCMNDITGNDLEITAEAMSWMKNADIGDIYTFREGLIQIVEVNDRSAS